MKVKRLSDELHQKVLGWTPQEIPSRVLRQSQHNWEAFGLQDATDPTEVVNLPYPEGLGTYQEVLAAAVEKYGRVHIDRLERFSRMAIPDLPGEKPYDRPGWQYWSRNREDWRPVDEPCLEDSPIILDTETVNLGDRWVPTCAVVLSHHGWYVWLADLHKEPLDSTFNLPGGCTIVGHNVPYDRQWLASEYSLQGSDNRFFDTMAAWITCRGFCNQQRPVYKSTEGDSRPGWTDETATNGLDAVYEFYTGQKLDKGVRDLIINKGLPWVRDNLTTVADYCLKDVRATFEVFRYVYPELRASQPSDVSLTGQLLLGSSWLPLSPDRFPRYYDRAEAVADQVISEAKEKIAQKVAELVASHQDTLIAMLEELKGVPRTCKAEKLERITQMFTELLPRQLQDLDWTPATTGKNKGLPAWYRGIKEITLKQRAIPAILGMTWRDEPILWGTVGVDDQGQPSEGYYTEAYGAIPHPEVRGQRVTCLFGKGFVTAVEDGTLDAPGGVKDLLAAVMSTINWVSLRSRVASIHTEAPEGFPVVLPQLTVTGTVTRRAADNIWQVASNPKAKRIGTELKSMVEAPKGYSLVGADVDSQELWIASALGDAALGTCGSTALGLMTLIGEKSQGTDVHSATARKADISRDLAKNFVYGCIYGLGLAGATNYLLKALPTETFEYCQNVATSLQNGFKGRKSEHTKRYIGGLASDFFNAVETIADSRCPETPVLKAKISKALRGNKDYKTTRVNWVVQSSGVDFRDAWLILTQYVLDHLGVDGRLLMTIHDEQRRLVREDQELLAVYGMQIAHLMVRAAFIDALGLDCIPAGIAWHSAVDVDKVLRKDPEADQVTPSQPEPIAPGRTVTASQLLAQGFH